MIIRGLDPLPQKVNQKATKINGGILRIIDEVNDTEENRPETPGSMRFLGADLKEDVRMLKLRCDSVRSLA